MGLIDKITDRLEAKLIKREKGYPIMYVIYDPTKKEPNVTYHSIHPELQRNAMIKLLSEMLADAVRDYYSNYPEKLDEINKMIEESKQ